MCGIEASLKVMPTAIAFALACLSELVYGALAGRVPFPRHAFWNLTRASLGFATTAITLEPPSPDLGYTPLFSNMESFEDIRDRRLEAQQNKHGGIKKGTKRPPKKTGTTEGTSEPPPEGAHSAIDPAAADAEALRDIDWAMRPLSPSQPQRLFDRLAGPGSTHWESLVTALAMIGTCWFAHVSADEVRIH